ncbi:PQQ-dependent dehydrogenase, methanol/ethanol family [Sphingomonas sp.]|uniref:PQQ-dependent dehydrogenase, methanol/ethanol family n=1 Tax=Sphingomonas sp. TaxID=28214 RepID=UPI003D6D5A32
MQHQTSRTARPSLWLGCAGLLMLATACDRQESSGWQRETAHYYTDAYITKDNVSRLGLAWEFDDFVVRGRTHRGMEATPVVVDGVMYLSGPWSVVYAIDAKTGKPLWQYDPEVDGQYARRTCCDVVNRGVAISDGIVYVGTLDGYLAAVDAKTGKQLWKSDSFVDRKMSSTITGAPRVAGDVVVIGNGGAELGARGYVTAFNRKTGKLAWRFYIVPGNPAKGDEHPEVAMARKTWDSDSKWELGGGGTAWDSMVYDPETDIVFIGTGNGMPHPVWTRSPKGGDNLFLSSILALDAKTGRMKWYYQTTPGDSWDYTATQNMVLTDIDIDGKKRKVIMQAPKNGFFYVLDRVSGALLSAEKYTTVTWAERVDKKTGRPVISPQSDYSKGLKLIWPAESGGHNWQPMAYSEQTKLVYIPVLQTPMSFTVAEQPYKPYSILQGVATSLPALDGSMQDKSRQAMFAGQPRPRFDSMLTAWDPVKHKAVWSSKPQHFWNGGTMATGGGLVFQGNGDGVLTIYDAFNGAILRRINIGTGIMSSPMAYTIDGVQYIAVAAGYGGAMHIAFPPGAAAIERENNERLLVFKIGGGPVRMPLRRTPIAFTDAPAQYRGDMASVDRGTALYYANCLRCHGVRNTLGAYPNLWKISPETHAAFNDIVRGGAYSYAGMASFSDVLSEKDVTDIHTFLSEPQPGGKKVLAGRPEMH